MWHLDVVGVELSLCHLFFFYAYDESYVKSTLIGSGHTDYLSVTMHCFGSKLGAYSQPTKIFLLYVMLLSR